MRVWVLARKDLRLLLRDRRATVVLLLFPLIFITILGMSTAARFGPQNSSVESFKKDGVSKKTVDAGGNDENSLPTTEDLQYKPKGHNVYQTLVPAYTVLFTFFLVNIMARSFLTEHDLGTLRRLRMAPVLPAELLLGKTLPFLIISLIQSLLLFLAGRFVFGMTWGPTPWLLLPTIFCTSLAATTLGLLVSTIVRTDAQVSSYANFLVLTMAGISGCFMPRSWLPETMQKASLVTPHAWSLIAYDEVLKRVVPEPSVVLQCCTTLVLFSGVFFIAGRNRFGRMG